MSLIASTGASPISLVRMVANSDHGTISTEFKKIYSVDISNAASNINFVRGFFHVIMINAFASGIIAGQLTEGNARDGLKYSVIMVILSYAASIIFFLK